MQITDLVFIDSAGYHVADYPSFLSWITTQYQNIYGADVYLEPDSQDGQFLAILAQAFFDTANLGASVFNSFSPATAQGVGLSRLVKINGLKRNIPSNSTVTVTITGTAGTVITNGVVQDTLQQLWNLPSTVTIPGGGSIDVVATAQVQGALTASSGTVTTIFTPTLGWQSVTNAAAATPGAAVETDAALRVRQQESTAIPALTVNEATAGALLNLSGVQKVSPYENDTGSTDGNGVPAHTMNFITVGGDTTQIAQTIALYKTPGVGTSGNTGPTLVYDSQGMPLNIYFSEANTAEIQVTVTGAAGSGYSSDFAPLIQAAIAAVINANKIGQTVVLSQLFAPAYLNGSAQGQTYTIASITIGKNSGMQGSSNITLDFDENAVCNPSVDITIDIT